MGKLNEYEITNPVFNTAKMTSYFLAESGNKYAKQILNTTGFDKELAINSFPGFQEMLLPNLVGQDVRYEAVNYQVRNAGNKVILDFACGFSPRGLEMANEGYQYCGGDLQMVVPVIKPIIKALAGNNSDNIEYMVVDVTDADSCNKASECFSEGPVTIITEGLLQYLNTTEKRTLFKNIASILKNRGGCYINPDCNTNDFALKICSSMMDQNAPEAVKKTHDAYSTHGDSDTGSTMVDPLEETIQFLRDAGLKAEVLPLYPEDEEFDSIMFVDEDKRAGLKKTISEGILIKATCDSDTSIDDDDVKIDFAVLPEYDEGKLKFKINGRLDSLNAPELVILYDSIDGADNADEVIVDFSNLQYVSSAGLRVLLSIKKKNMDRKFRIINASDSIKEIFDLTGFSKVMDIN